jgi:GntR family transcriptional regulator, regulator for abcA and norABC
VPYHRTKGGLNLWVKIPEDISTEKLLIKSLDHSISFVPGQVCDPLKESSSSIRLSYSYANEKQLSIGLKKFIHLAKSL